MVSVEPHPAEGRQAVRELTDRPDPEVFAQFFQANFRSLAVLAAVMGAEDPEDLAQEALARVHMRPSLFAEEGLAPRYVRTIVRNLARTQHRHRAVVRKMLPRLAAIEHTDDLPDTDASAVVAAVRALPLRQREVVVLRYWLGLSEAEIAAELGITAGAVKTHASRAIGSLKSKEKDLR